MCVWISVYICAYICIHMYIQEFKILLDFAGPTTDNYKVSTWKFSWGNTSHPTPNLMHTQWTLDTGGSFSGGLRPIHPYHALMHSGFLYRCLHQRPPCERGRGQLIHCAFQVPLCRPLYWGNLKILSSVTTQYSGLYTPSHPTSISTRFLRS